MSRLSITMSFLIAVTLFAFSGVAANAEGLRTARQPHHARQHNPTKHPPHKQPAAKRHGQTRLFHRGHVHKRGPSR